MKSKILIAALGIGIIAAIVRLDLSAKRMNAGKPNRSSYLGGSSFARKASDAAVDTFLK